MNSKELIRISKFLSLVLRHNPSKIGLTLDSEGWASVPELLQKANIDMSTLEQVVAENNKKRFAFNENKSKIRASQGHSIDVDLKLEPKEPPDILFHGTVGKFIESIKRQGLIKGNRRHVHLSKDVRTATKVGERRGHPVILDVDAKAMHGNGFKFYLSDNGVWLTDIVPPQYLTVK